MKKILVIEDDPTMLKILQSRLTREPGVELSIAIESAEGLHKIKAERPDLVMLDLVLPGTSGLDLLAEIKKHPATRATPVLVFSMAGAEEKIKQALQLGAIGYVVKGTISLEELMTKIQGALRLPA